MSLNETTGARPVCRASRYLTGQSCGRLPDSSPQGYYAESAGLNQAFSIATYSVRFPARSPAARQPTTGCSIAPSSDLIAAPQYELASVNAATCRLERWFQDHVPAGTTFTGPGMRHPPCSLRDERNSQNLRYFLRSEYCQMVEYLIGGPNSLNVRGGALGQAARCAIIVSSHQSENAYLPEGAGRPRERDIPPAVN